MTAHNDREKKLFGDVLASLVQIETWFETLSEQEFTFNEAGFRNARTAAVQMKEDIKAAYDRYAEIPEPTKDNFNAFYKDVADSFHTNYKVISNNHDSFHDAYRTLQVFFKSVLEKLEGLINYVAKELELEDDYDISSWVQPEDTTRSLFDTSIQHLVNFFHPNSSGDHDAEQGADHDKKHGQDNN